MPFMNDVESDGRYFGVGEGPSSEPSAELAAGSAFVILEAGLRGNHMVFESRKKAGRVWLTEHLGPDAIIADVPAEEAFALKTPRLGFRADTHQMMHQWASS